MLLSLVLGIALTVACSKPGLNERVERVSPQPAVRVALSKHGLPADFFAPGVDTNCAHRIIGYRFVAWLNDDMVAVGFNTSPNCRVSPSQKVDGSARVLAFTSGGLFKAQRDIPYHADGYGQLVAEGEAGPGPNNTLLFRIQSVNLDEQGSRESKSGILLLDSKLQDVARIERFLAHTTLVEHTPVFQDGPSTYAILDELPSLEAKRLDLALPIGTRDRKIGGRGVAFIHCQQELRPGEYAATDVVYAGARTRCSMTMSGKDGQSWTATLKDGETASIVGLLADGSVAGIIKSKGGGAGQLVVWSKSRPPESLPWIPSKYCASVDSPTSDMSRYAVFASEDCEDVFSILGVRDRRPGRGHWMVFDRKSRSQVVDYPLPTNARAALAPDGLHYATFEAGELRIYQIP